MVRRGQSDIVEAGEGRGGTSSKRDIETTSSDGDAEPRAKMSKEEAADDEFSDLLAQPRDVLVKFCNYLDPHSLREFAFTCKYLFTFCRQIHGIVIPFHLEKVKGTVARSSFWHMHGDRRQTQCPLDSILDKLFLWSFSVQINVLEFNVFRSSGENWEKAKSWMKERFWMGHVKKIRCMKTVPAPRTVREAEEFKNDFVKAFDVEEIELIPSFHLSRETVEAVLKFPVAKLEIGRDAGLCDFSLLNCSIPVLHMQRSITLTSFDQIIQIWRTRGNLENWQFFYRFESSDFMEFFDHFEIRCYDYEGLIDRHNPPVFLKLGDNRSKRTTISVYLLREDGRIVCVTLDPPNVDASPYIEFGMCPLAEGPLALRNL